MHKFWALIALVAGTVQPAYALECLVPSVQRDYWWHKESSESYTLVLGEFSNLKPTDKSHTKDVDVSPALEYVVWRADFKGFKASLRAFDQPFETEVTLILPDFSRAVGGDMAYLVDFLPGKTGLVWMMESQDGFRATAELCSEFIDTNPANLEPALRCLRGGYCPKPD